MAIHIFNISVDMPDSRPDYIAEDLTINDQESVIELVLEQCLGIDNAIAEYDEPDDDSQTFEMSKEFKVYSNSYQQIVFFQPHITTFGKIPYGKTYTSNYVIDITPPPPKS